MIYEIYTLPNCEKCSEVKEILNKKNVNYEEIDLGMSEGRKKFKEFYKDIRGMIVRDENNMAILPIVIKRDNSKIETLVQGSEDIEKLFN